MFDYANKLQLALGDKARRTGLKLGAGVVGLIALGFLLSALWSFLAWRLELGPTYASLIIGGGFLLIAIIMLAVSNAERHRMPTTDELKSEVEARLSLATDTALDKAKGKAEETMSSAQARVASLFGRAEGKARSLVGKAGEHAQDAGADLSETLSEVKRKAEDGLEEAKDSFDRAMDTRARPGVGLVSAFAVGLAIARSLKGRRDDYDPYYDPYYGDDDPYYDDLYAEEAFAAARSRDQRRSTGEEADWYSGA
ncbi:CsbD family protein [Paracoccus sediminicola]|uniref:CsbD family protein n=1 Tax=Paracoccus sediminicola TaxID=3017783 RepID=UPI0022EFF004|nr:CsbD family protein [Paracoccus sediminicola]WBU57833.1 CsbD family protein [Paracoccus sediminicola]